MLWRSSIDIHMYEDIHRYLYVNDYDMQFYRFDGRSSKAIIVNIIPEL